MVAIAHTANASARANTTAPTPPAGTAAGTNGKGANQSSRNPARIANAHAIGGRTTTFAVSAVLAMAGPVNSPGIPHCDLCYWLKNVAEMFLRDFFL